MLFHVGGIQSRQAQSEAAQQFLTDLQPKACFPGLPKHAEFRTLPELLRCDWPQTKNREAHREDLNVSPTPLYRSKASTFNSSEHVNVHAHSVFLRPTALAKDDYFHGSIVDDPSLFQNEHGVRSRSFDVRYLWHACSHIFPGHSIPCRTWYARRLFSIGVQ